MVVKVPRGARLPFIPALTVEAAFQIIRDVQVKFNSN